MSPEQEGAETVEWSAMQYAVPEQTAFYYSEYLVAPQPLYNQSLGLGCESPLYNQGLGLGCAADSLPGLLKARRQLKTIPPAALALGCSEEDWQAATSREHDVYFE